MQSRAFDVHPDRQGWSQEQGVWLDDGHTLTSMTSLLVPTFRDNL